MSTRIAPIIDLQKRNRRRDQVALSRSRAVTLLLALIAILVVVGLGAIMSASSAGGIMEQSDRMAVVKRQVRWVMVGSFVMIVASYIPYQLYKRFAVTMLGVSTLGLLLVAMFGLTSGGGQRWLRVGEVTVQTSEFSKLAVVVFLASVLTDRKDRLDDLRVVLGPVVASVGVTCVVVALQPDLGTALIIAGAGGVLVLASGVPMRHIVGGGVVVGALAGLATVLLEYRRERFRCFLDPFSDPSDECFQLVQSLIALGNGNLFGVGLGASRSRWAYLPNSHTDFIFTIIGEELGFLGAIGLLLALAGLSVLGIWIAYRTSDMFARLLVAGITAWLGVQSLVNVGGVVGAIPVTGLALPFVSVGGSAMVVAMAAVGILINIARTAPHTAEVGD